MGGLLLPRTENIATVNEVLKKRGTKVPSMGTPSVRFDHHHPLLCSQLRQLSPQLGPDPSSGLAAHSEQKQTVNLVNIDMNRRCEVPYVKEENCMSGKVVAPSYAISTASAQSCSYLHCFFSLVVTSSP